MNDDECPIISSRNKQTNSKIINTRSHDAGKKQKEKKLIHLISLYCCLIPLRLLIIDRS